MNLPFSFMSFAPPVGRDVEAEWFGVRNKTPVEDDTGRVRSRRPGQCAGRPKHEECPLRAVRCPWCAVYACSPYPVTRLPFPVAV